jgi:hypothetical protein
MKELPAPVRSLWPVSLILSGIACAAVVAAGISARFSVPLVVVPVGLLMVFIDHWTASIAPRVRWSFGEAVVFAALVQALPGQAPLTAALLGAVIAMTDLGRESVDFDSFLTNVSQFVVTGFVAGYTFELLRPTDLLPSTALALAVAASALAWIATNAALVTFASRFRYGPDAVAGLAASLLPLVWRTVLLAVSVGVVASTVNLLGPAWIVVVMVLTVTLAALPLIKMRTEAQRTELVATVTAALNARGVVSDADGRLERTAVDAGQRLQFSAKRIEQLRYVILLYLATDNFTGTLPKSIDDQLRDESESATSSSALLFGLPLSDVADQTVIRLAEAAAEFDALRFPPGGGTGISRDAALSELEKAGTRVDVVAALASREYVSDAYLRAWRLHPEFVWRAPRRSLARRA